MLFDGSVANPVERDGALSEETAVGVYPVIFFLGDAVNGQVVEGAEESVAEIYGA